MPTASCLDRSKVPAYRGNPRGAPLWDVASGPSRLSAASRKLPAVASTQTLRAISSSAYLLEKGILQRSKELGASCTELENLPTFGEMASIRPSSRCRPLACQAYQLLAGASGEHTRSNDDRTDRGLTCSEARTLFRLNLSSCCI